jgi:hypothetical protein
MRAAGKGDDGMVQMLIDKKANVDAHNHNAKPALVYAARNGHLSIVRVLLAANANPDGPHRRVRTPLAHACQEGHLDVVHALVAAGAAIDREDFYRDNGLTLAIDTARDALYGYDEAMRRKTKKERDTIFARQCETIRWMLFYGAAIDHVGKFKTPRTYLDATEFIMQGINVFQIPRTEAKDLKTGR